MPGSKLLFQLCHFLVSRFRLSQLKSNPGQGQGWTQDKTPTRTKVVICTYFSAIPHVTRSFQDFFPWSQNTERFRESSGFCFGRVCVLFFDVLSQQNGLSLWDSAGQSLAKQSSTRHRQTHKFYCTRSLIEWATPIGTYMPLDLFSASSTTRALKIIIALLPFISWKFMWQ